MYLYLTTKKKRELDMAGNNIFSDKDTMDINELASLNDDISPELIEQLQQKLTLDAQALSGEPPKTEFNENDDSTLFEEPVQKQETPIEGTQIENPEETQDKNEDVVEEKEETPQPKKTVNIDKSIDDNFIKKYKAKLNKQKVQNGETANPEAVDENTISNAAFTYMPPAENNNIEELSQGKITEKPLTPEIKSYNDSLDLLDGNVKYSKYVMYIEPQNVDFIESLTVKERKNLINKILKEQNDIAITRQRFRMVQTVIKHAVVAILTIAISIPIIYITINASLEASINNYRRSQSMFQTLYKQGGKIKAIN